MAAKRVVVTGGNSGIGLALCGQLAAEHGCRVFLGSRDQERGAAAVAAVKAKLPAGCAGSVELLVVDVSSDESVAAAATSVKAALGGGEQLYGLVNNAGVGLAAKATPEDVVGTNLHGTRRMTEAFLPLLTAGRIVNVGSGAGPSYVKRVPAGPAQHALCTEPADWAAIEAMLATSADGTSGFQSKADSMGGYGISKALVTSYTMLLAKEHPAITSSCCTPGFIDTKLVAGFGATKPPAEGTVAIKHCLFGELKGNGWYYGSDAVRSPLHFMRNPGEPEYDGTPP